MRKTMKHKIIYVPLTNYLRPNKIAASFCVLKNKIPKPNFKDMYNSSK